MLHEKNTLCCTSMAYVLAKLHTHFLLCLLEEEETRMYTHIYNDAGVDNKVLIIEVLPTCCHPSNTQLLLEPFTDFLSFSSPTSAVFEVCK